MAWKVLDGWVDTVNTAMLERVVVAKNKDKNRVVVEPYEPSVGSGHFYDRIAINPFNSRYIDRRLGRRKATRRA